VVTQYETTYAISLDSIPQQISLDSGFVDIYVNGELWKRVDWTKIDLSNDQIHFLITTLKGDNIQIQYALYSKGLAIASGTDEYDPENQTSSNSAGLLIRHTEAIETILEELNGKSSSENPSISSEIPILSSETMTSSSSSEISSSSQPLSSSNLSSSLEASSSSSAILLGQIPHLMNLGIEDCDWE